MEPIATSDSAHFLTIGIEIHAIVSIGSCHTVAIVFRVNFVARVVDLVAREDASGRTCAAWMMLASPVTVLAPC